MSTVVQRTVNRRHSSWPGEVRSRSRLWSAVVDIFNVQFHGALPCYVNCGRFVLLALAVWLCRLPGCQPSPTGHSLLSVHESGTICRLMWRLLSRWLHSANGRRPIYLQNLNVWAKLASWTLIIPIGVLTIGPFGLCPPPVWTLKNFCIW